MFLSRKYGSAGRDGILRVASMGPGCFYPGNQAKMTKRQAERELQWGRDVSIPEIWQCRTGRYTPCRFNGTGMFLSRKSGQNDEKAGRARASMGPGCFYPGNMAVPDGTVYSVSLQWDRDVSIPEIRPK